MIHLSGLGAPYPHLETAVMPMRRHERALLPFGPASPAVAR